MDYENREQVFVSDDLVGVDKKYNKMLSCVKASPSQVSDILHWVLWTLAKHVGSLSAMKNKQKTTSIFSVFDVKQHGISKQHP